MIAHRLSTIENCDKVVEIKEGKSSTLHHNNPRVEPVDCYEYQSINE